MANQTIPARADIPPEDRWAIEDLYPNDDAFLNEFQAVEREIPRFSPQFADTLSQSAGQIAACLGTLFPLEQRLERLVVYANQKLHEDTANSVYQDFADRTTRLSVQLSQAAAFLEPELLSIPEETLRGFLNADALAPYRRVIEEIARNRAHTLSASMEHLLSSAGEMAGGPGDIFSAFTNADLKFPIIEDEKGAPVELTEVRYVPFLKSQTRSVRKAAFEALFSTYGSYRNTLAATFSANIKKTLFFSRARGFESTREASLFYNRVPLDVYDNLVKTVNAHLPLLHRYIALRKRLLGVDALHMYDLYVPMVPDVTMDFPFDKAKETVIDSLAPLGSGYQDTLREAFQSRWIDVYENRGKRGGAYSWGAYGVHPYVLLNHKADLNGVFTLSHEMGHALHSYYSDQAQPYQYAGYKIFVAEVASTCNESLLIRHLLGQADEKAQRLYLLNHFLEEFRGTVFRQTMFAAFEQTVHGLLAAGESLTAERLCSLYREINRVYYGPDVVLDEGIEMEWARIPHFYTPFYVYQYATGFSAAIALSQRILEENGASDYLSFLRGGCSKDPIDLLKGAGVDMTTPAPVAHALSLFSDLLDQMEEALSA
ncbi:MAG: oligoendopeptidase F [Oscillospiraceae bacterium]|jgi:oligoendopeptidase F